MSKATQGKNSLRILVLIHEYPPVGGGGGRVAQDLCLGLADRGHELKVLTANYGDLQMVENPLPNLEILRLASGRSEPYRADMKAMRGYLVAAIAQGRRLIRTWKPDVLHIHFAVPAGAAAWSLYRMTRVPYLMTVHLGDVPGGVPDKTSNWFRWIKPMTGPIWKNASKIIAVSQFTRGLALQHYRVPIDVLFNGVDLKKLNPGEIKVNDPPLILFAGRFVTQKDPLSLLRILGEVKDLPWRCVLIGDGPLRPQMEALIGELGLTERVQLTGWLSPEEVIDWYRQGDIFLMPSLSEGLPVVGVQALAMGLALLLSDIGGCVDLVNDGKNGALLPVGDIGGFANKLRAYLTDRESLQAARVASRRHAELFDLQKIVTAYEKALTETAARTRR